MITNHLIVSSFWYVYEQIFNFRSFILPFLIFNFVRLGTNHTVIKLHSRYIYVPSIVFSFYKWNLEGLSSNGFLLGHDHESRGPPSYEWLANTHTFLIYILTRFLIKTAKLHIKTAWNLDQLLFQSSTAPSFVG